MSVNQSLCMFYTGLQNITTYKVFTNGTLDGSSMHPILYLHNNNLLPDNSFVQMFKETLSKFECLLKCLEMNNCHAVQTVHVEFGGNNEHDMKWCILLQLTVQDGNMCVVQRNGSSMYTPASVFKYIENWGQLPSQEEDVLQNDYAQKSMAILIKGEVYPTSRITPLICNKPAFHNLHI